MTLKNLRAYQINLLGLANKVHEFSYEMDKSFFEHFPNNLFEWAEGNVKLVLNKGENLLTAEFEITGSLGLVCDRSLEKFAYPFQSSQKIYFKYASQYEEVNEEIVHIPFNAEKLDLAQFIYEFFALEVPLRKIHPDFDDTEDEDEEFSLIYTSGGEEDDQEATQTPDEDNIDPRWQILKNLKN